MIKITYYIGMNDKDTLKQELSKSDFITEFDKLFRDYTVFEAQGRFTNRVCEVTFERTLVVTTFIDDCIDIILKQAIKFNCDTLKEKLNQESILVEIAKPDVVFL